MPPSFKLWKANEVELGGQCTHVDHQVRFGRFVSRPSFSKAANEPYSPPKPAQCFNDPLMKWGSASKIRLKLVPPRE